MKRSFYHYIRTLRKPQQSEKDILIEGICDDIAFPKQSDDYQEISHYLEDNAYYVTSMDLFDELWEDYLENSN